MNDCIEKVLEEYAGCNAYDRQQQSPEAKDVNAGDPCRSECTDPISLVVSDSVTMCGEEDTIKLV